MSLMVVALHRQRRNTTRNYLSQTSRLCRIGLGGSSSSAHQTAKNVNIHLDTLISDILTHVHHFGDHLQDTGDDNDNANEPPHY